MAASPKTPYDRCVFVNCPFDTPYKLLLDAILFAIHECGFIARTALEVTGSAETRLDKIIRIIRESRWSVHDISRVEVTSANPLPRFNMPFECGLALGLQRFGARKDRARDFLVLAARRHQDKRTLSDLAGQDGAYHHNKPAVAIDAIRKFLAPKSPSPVRGGTAIKTRYKQFQSELPKLLTELEISEKEIHAFDYVPELLKVMIEWQRRKNAGRVRRQ
jgi:hypothetical protein